MSHDTETDLIRAAQAGDGAATSELLERYAPALRNAARQYSAAVDADDAGQEALCAFLESLRDFDPDRGTKLTQFFAWRVRTAIADLTARRESFTIEPRRYREYLTAIKVADGDVGRALLACREGRAELSAQMFLNILAVSRGTASLDELREFTHEPAITQLDFDTAEPLYPANPMFRPTMPTPSEVADVHYALSIVDDRERLVCKYAYGFIENRPMSGAEVADAMPIPTERGRRWTEKTVNDTRRKALDKMRAALVA